MHLLNVSLSLLLIVSLSVDAATDGAVRAALRRLQKGAASEAFDRVTLPGFDRRAVANHFDVNFRFERGVATELSKFDVRGVKVDAAGGVEIRAALPMINLGADYVLNGTLLGLPVKGAGSADLNVMDVVVETRGVCSADGAKLRTTMTLGSSQLLLQWLPQTDGIFRKMLKHFADKVFEHYRPLLEESFSRGIERELEKGGDEGPQRFGPAALPAAFTLFEAGNANEFLDQMIANARPALADNDPISLPDARYGFDKNVLGVRVHGEAKAFGGSLAGIQTLHRTGDSELTQSEDLTQLNIKAHLGMAHLHGHYKMHAKFMNIGPSGSISVKVSLISVEIHVNIDMSSAPPKATLEHFDITYIGKIDISFDGLGPLDWIINPLGNLIVNKVKHKIADAVEGPLKKLIASKLATGNIPIG